MVTFDDIDLLEIFDGHLDISASDLDINDDLLLLGACECVAVLCVWLEGIGYKAVCCELELSEFRLGVDDDFRLFVELELHKEQAFGTRWLGYGGHFVCDLGAFLLVLGKLVETFLDIVLRFADSGLIVGEAFVSCYFDVGLL